jgi:hypothetical protein
MKKTWMKVAIAVVVVVAVALFYWFRPDRLFTNVRVDEGMPANQSSASTQPVEVGTFYTILHPTSGTATIYKMGDGRRVLRFTNFDTSNGPDVHVYMVASDDAKDAATVARAGFIDLGSIKGNVGDQNYTLPTDLDLAKYRAVSIWCKRFSVNFGAAALKPTESSQVR